MYFTKLRLYSSLASFDLPIWGALPSDRYILKAADGLGPPEVDVSIATTLQQGGVYQGRRPQGREAVIRIGLNPDYAAGKTAAQLRSDLYALLTPRGDESIQIQMVDGNTVVAKTDCYIKKFETVPFSKETEVQITFGCPDPYLEAPDLLTLPSPNRTISGTNTLFDIPNIGDAPSGFVMSIVFTAQQLGSLKIMENVTNPPATMTISTNINQGDTLIVDTRPGSRGVWRQVGSNDPVTVLDDFKGRWLMLHGGLNQIKVNSPNFTWGADGFAYLPTYWGI